MEGRKIVTRDATLSDHRTSLPSQWLPVVNMINGYEHRAKDGTPRWGGGSFHGLLKPQASGHARTPTRFATDDTWELEVRGFASVINLLSVSYL